MAPKKAKKGKKDGKELTPEEKKAKADMLALKAEEVRRKKEAASKARLLQLKNLEEQYSKENLRTIHDRWRKVMRAAKVTELHEDTQTLSECYEYEVKQKDSTIASLMQQLSEAEQQREMAFSKHLQIVDGLINMHYTRMKDMEDEFQDNLQKLEKSFESERLHIASAHEKQKKELDDMIHAMENEFKESKNDLRQEFEASREEIKNKNTEEYNVLKLSLERSIEELERQIEETHQAYLERTDSKTQAFKRMIEKDKVTAHLIEQRMRKLLHLHESIAYRRAKISTDSREWEARNKAMRDQKDEMNKHYQDLKRKISRLRNQEHEELKAISKISEEVQLELKKKLEMAEHILNLGELNSKLEVEQENIFPFDPLHCSALHSNPRYHMRDNKSQQAPGLQQEPSKKDGTIADTTLEKSTMDFPHREQMFVPKVTNEEGKEVEELDYLSNFYKKYNKVLLDKMALESQKKMLHSEVEKMKISLGRLLDGFTGSNDEMVKKFKILMNKTWHPPQGFYKPNTICDILRILKKSTSDLATKCRDVTVQI